MNDLIIGIISAPKNKAARTAIRETWGARAKELGVPYVFVIGHSDSIFAPELTGDMLHIPMEEKYKHLPQKTKWLCHWFYNQNKKFLFKCDDDTYVDVEKLLKYEIKADYVGCRCAPGVASGGAGYFLSREACATVAMKMIENVGAEDVNVAHILAKYNINLLHDDKFDPAHFGLNHKIPKKDNDMITTHYVSPKGMHLIYDMNK